jgi:DNA-nicking Smr family endonuclease
MLPDEEDELFWLETVKDINHSPTVNKIVYKKNKQIEVKPRRQYAVKQEFTTYSKALEDYENSGIDKSTLNKFKKEEFKVEAILDLHGYKEDDAFEKVEDFIAACYSQGKRCIIIVTGKGNIHPNDDIYVPKGILKKQTPQWLNTPRIRSMILIFKNPSERLGGQGALYILLRRNKEL